MVKECLQRTYPLLMKFLFLQSQFHFFIWEEMKYGTSFRDAVDELFQTPPQVVELSSQMTFIFHFTMPIQC